VKVKRQQASRLPAGGWRWRVWVRLPHAHDVPVEEAAESYGLAKRGLREGDQGPVAGFIYLWRNDPFGVKASSRTDADKVEGDETERQGQGQSQSMLFGVRDVCCWLGSVQASVSPNY
jgi:hypothetical protein